jgi:hypothetical protein
MALAIELDQDVDQIDGLCGRIQLRLDLATQVVLVESSVEHVGSYAASRPLDMKRAARGNQLSPACEITVLDEVCQMDERSLTSRTGPDSLDSVAVGSVSLIWHALLLRPFLRSRPSLNGARDQGMYRTPPESEIAAYAASVRAEPAGRIEPMTP